MAAEAVITAQLERLVTKLPPGRARQRYEKVLAEARQTPHKTHWVYEAWSKLLDARVWFVHCAQEVDELVNRQGISRGAIYTEAELVELLRLPGMSAEALIKLHLVKSFFDATVVSREPSLEVCKTEYTTLLKQHKTLEAYLDDLSVPEEQRKEKIGEFQRLVASLNLLIEQIRGLGCPMSSAQILNGFDG